ncbi:MAG: outer membrane protein assembly factor BamD [Acidobacteria bacterium]|nr:outer membrane protein assembly factor BamD [Acidobacteriota bacterium]
MVIRTLLHRSICGVFLCCCLPLLLCAQKQRNAQEYAVAVVDMPVYITADTHAEKLATMEAGREMAILPESARGWLHVIANIEGGPLETDADQPQGKNITGWVQERGAVRGGTPNGDRILFGAAVEAETEASRRGGRKGAAQQARRLYSLLPEDFPSSPLAGEAAWRAADIRWQIERADAFSRPSAKQSDPNMRERINEDYLRKVERKFPHTKWADLAAYDLIDNKICGEWNGAAKCPEKEAELYEKYAAEHPQSPRAAEALYNAAWRQSALMEIYKGNGEPKKAEQARNQALTLAQRLVSQYSDSDYAARGSTLLYKINQNIPTYGNASE